MTDPDLQALIRQAEIQQQQLKLEVQLQKNLELFKQHAPVLYEEYVNYEATELHLSYDAEGHLHLVNSRSGNPVYRVDPKSFCDEQVERFCANPTWFKVGFNPPRNDMFFQNEILADLVDKYDPEIKQLQGSIDRPIGTLVITGCGLGYHLENLLNRVDAYTVCIFEPSKDSFYASLHTIDWKPIIDYISRPNRLLKLFIAGENDKTITILRLLTHRIGLHNIANTYIYRHHNSEKADSFLRELRKQFHLTLTGTGFLEDEQISVAHTAANINNQIPVLVQNKPLTRLPPACIIGNGPSLDGLIDTLRDIQDRTILFSCGSTLGTLEKHGIVPDFHIEMERTAETTIAVKLLAPEEFTRKINLLALNTVPPEALSLFMSSAIAAKVNDPGERMLNDAFDRELPRLNACNPTCTNTGVAFALHFGFEELLLAGVDLGMKEDHQHHAASSQYYDDEENLLTATPLPKNTLTAKGNFSHSVKTNSLLSTSRANMEIAFQNHPNAKIYNLNDGVLIKGAIPTPADQLPKFAPLPDKQQQIDRILDHFFAQPATEKQLDEQKIRAVYTEDALRIMKATRFNQNPRNMAEVQQELDAKIAEINDLYERSPVSYWLLSGSYQNFFTLIHRACLAAKSQEELAQVYRNTTNEFLRFLKLAYRLIDKDIMKLHAI